MGQERGMDRARRREEQEAEEAQAQESEIKAVYRGCCGAGVRHRGGRVERPAGAPAPGPAPGGAPAPAARAPAPAPGPAPAPAPAPGAAPAPAHLWTVLEEGDASVCSPLPDEVSALDEGSVRDRGASPQKARDAGFDGEAEDDVSDLGSPRVILDDAGVSRP